MGYLGQQSSYCSPWDLRWELGLKDFRLTIITCSVIATVRTWWSPVFMWRVLMLTDYQRHSVLDVCAGMCSDLLIQTCNMFWLVRYEQRNTIIKVVVIMIICVITLLTLYMAYLFFIDSLVAKWKQSSYTQQKEEEVLLLSWCMSGVRVQLSLIIYDHDHWSLSSSFQMMLQDRVSPSPESEDISTLSSRENINMMTSRGRLLGRSAALQRIGNQQDRWRRQVNICT